METTTNNTMEAGDIGNWDETDAPTKARFRDTMLAIAKEHLAKQDRANWLRYGFLPSTRELYARWRARGGERFPTRTEFEYALGAITVPVTNRSTNVTDQSHPFHSLDQGGRWVHFLVLWGNCSAQGWSQDQHDYVQAILRQSLAESKERFAESELHLAGAEAVLRGVKQGADTDTLRRVGKEYGLDQYVDDGLVSGEEELFADEHLTPAPAAHPDVQRVARMDMLRAEARAQLLLDGVPEAEITDDAVGHYVFTHLSEAEIMAWGLPSREELDEDLLIAHIALALDDEARARGEPPGPLGEEDPKRAQRILDMKQYLRKQEETEAYWHAANTDDEQHDGASDAPGGDA
jgi:hypothetical protein